MQKIVPFLWFESKAEEAVKFYVSLFKNSKITNISHYTKEMSEAAKMPEGSVMVIEFELAEQKFMAINGGAAPEFKFSPAISFFVNCKTQKEIDYLWEKLSEGGTPNVCGWLTDKYGVAWQIVPTVLGKMMAGKDQEKSKRAMAAMLKMKKLDIEALQQAYDGESA